ncbi:MAG TPA: transglutaminase family protein [Capsulimonadaceae bacterium]|jgi:transglutaminase-like putative cysteine protease
MNHYLRSTDNIDWETPAVRELARGLAGGASGEVDVARRCYEWVRDEIRHSGDYRASVTTCRASDVLREGTGWCYAKSHLLAALLRANGIPAGLCYQRLLLDDDRDVFTLHGLNAVHLREYDWYRVDPRGNKAGVDAQFCPPVERLAWLGDQPGEVNFPEILADPEPCIVECLTTHCGWEAVRANLPDFTMISSLTDAHLESKPHD